MNFNSIQTRITVAIDGVRSFVKKYEARCFIVLQLLLIGWLFAVLHHDGISQLILAQVLFVYLARELQHNDGSFFGLKSTPTLQEAIDETVKICYWNAAIFSILAVVYWPLALCFIGAWLACVLFNIAHGFLKYRLRRWQESRVVVVK